ncbi:acetolactate decarboxylase [Clostridium beijerinckii]|uniref:acetolactate decarboxylase n=1 Tax=Clostridium beijerinckii TaxID=1520 RepID=UPI002227B258|nr:acetolactate decarboxylase [Clostridium beijerinckii]UYZ35653.1 acetolactate decarboxylase [Clostridium beijerinckii]
MINNNESVNFNKDTIFQVSTLEALLAGSLDGFISIKDLKTKGDFGIGGITGLDGAIVVLDGKWYHCKDDCRIFSVNDNEKSPKFMISSFKTDKIIDINKEINYEGMKKIINSERPTPNIMYAVKIEGKFNNIKFKVYPKQNKPYPMGSLIARSKRERILENVKGTLVGYLMPNHLLDITSVEYHLHFVSEDKMYGGHLIDFELSEGNVHLDYKHNLQLVVPQTEEYYKGDLYNRKFEIEEISNIVYNKESQR